MRCKVILTELAYPFNMHMLYQQSYTGKGYTWVILGRVTPAGLYWEGL